ncbi:hypothetical protein ACP4OV_020884 [Aristida adscensionis]
MAAPPLLWVVLRAIPRVSDLPDHADLSLALAAPPRLTHLTVSPRVSPDPHDGTPSSPWLLAADPSSGLLLLLTPPRPSPPPPAAPRVSCDATDVERVVINIQWRTQNFFLDNITDAADPDYHVLHLPSATAACLPARTAGFGSISPDLGVIAAPATVAYMVVGFQFIIGSKGATLLCFSSWTSAWSGKAMHNPLPRWI